MPSSRTELNLPATLTPTALTDKAFTTASCFSNAIGSKIIDSIIASKVNPFATVYNPYSIHKLIEYAVANRSLPQASFLQREDIFLNYDFHSEFASLSSNEVKQNLETIISTPHNFLREAEWIIITYGTAWV